MTKQKVEVIVRDLPKKGDFETLNIYLKNVPVYYPVVHEAKKKYQSEDREFSVTAFVDEAAKDRLLDEVMVNKTFAEVGVSKTSKPPRKIKYPLSSQVEEGKANYDLVDGLWGFSVAKAEFSKQGNPMSVNVIDLEGKPFTENVGNGSIVNLKLFGYKNRDNQVVVQLDTVQVVEHVAFESKGAADSVADDVLGVSYSVKKADKPVAQQEEEAPKSKAKPATPSPAQDFDSFDDDIPFAPIGLQEGKLFLHMI
ncbi:MAG: single-stranded DNA-binding protein [Myoviridae sp. ctThM1]|nr:MAG: single-stranded DNA-binding protein [Myoviridae sp. ctThM1]